MSPRWILRSRGNIDAMTWGWPRVETPEASSYSWCLQSWWPTENGCQESSWVDWNIEGPAGFRYEISDLFLFIPFTEYISLNFPYRVRRLWFRIETVVLPPQEDLSMAVVNLCNTFKAQYLEVCKEDIVSDKRWERAHCLYVRLISISQSSFWNQGWRYAYLC